MRKAGAGALALALAVFVCTQHDTRGAEETVYFARDSPSEGQVHASVRGTFSVVPFDAAGVLPDCTPLMAHTLACAFGYGSICAVRLLPLIAAHKTLLEELGVPLDNVPVACIYSNYALSALGLDSFSCQTRAMLLNESDVEGFRIDTITGGQ